MEPQFEVIEAGEGRIIKAWKKGVPFEEKGKRWLGRERRLLTL
jgi:hypothetical protein